MSRILSSLSRLFMAGASLVIVTIASFGFSNAAGTIDDLRLEFCQNGNVSNTLTFEKGTAIPAGICVRYTNLSNSSVSIKSELVDGYLMADGRRACRENDESKTGFAKVAKFKVGNQTVDTVNVAINANSSVETQVLPGFSSVTNATYGCVVVYVDSAASSGISIVTRRAITLGFLGTTTSGSNIVQDQTATGTTATGTTATGTTATGTTATGTTATGVTSTGTTATGTTSTGSSVQSEPAPDGGTIEIPSDLVGTDAVGIIESSDVDDSGNTSDIVAIAAENNVDPVLLAIIQANPALLDQMRTAGSQDAALSGLSAAISSLSAASAGASTESPCSGYGDLSSGSEFCGYVQILSAKSVIREDSSFEPDRSITRAELLKIVMLASELSPRYDPAYTYDDIAADDWWAPYVSTAKKYGYISQTNTIFRPNDPITRAEASKMVVMITAERLFFN